METEDKTIIVSLKLGHMGRMLSGSKSGYSNRHPSSRVFFNGNIYDSCGEKIWYGDIDLTKEQKVLVEIAQLLGEDIYVTREQPFRWEEQTPQMLQAACQGEHPSAYIIQPQPWNDYGEKRMTKKEQRDPNYCSQHPEYGAKRRPKPGCQRCADKWNRFHAAPVTVPARGATIPPLTVTKRKVNRFAFVIDRSGSMQSLTLAAIKALRENIETIRQQALQTGQESRITIISFDDHIDTLFFDQPVQHLPYFGDNSFGARGSTALFDATGQAIEKLSDIFIGGDEDAAYLVMSITDGAENASKRFSADSLKALMGRVQATDRWTLTFLLPPGAKRNFCTAFGLPEGNVQEWEGTVQGVQNYAVQNSTGLSNYYSDRTIGRNSTKAFYTDMSKVTTKEIKAKLADISSQVNVWTVEKETKIRDFCEKKIVGPFLKGAAFYALTKDEKKVQPYKQILIMEKGKTSVYCGAAARQLLGLPDNQTVKVIPGNHANYDIFVQSTSTNRVVVRGTKVVYYPAIGVPYKEGPSAPRARAKK